MHATITNLEPGKEYEFMVLSEDRFGDGMFSKAFRTFTKGELLEIQRIKKIKMK